MGLDQIVIALPIHVLGLLCWNHLPVTRSIPVGHCQTCPISSLACLRLSRNRKALHSHSTAVLHGSFAPPPKCNVGQTHPAGGIKKIVSTTLPINIAFWGGRGEGAATKTVVKFRCGLRVTRFRSALTLYTVLVMVTTPQPSDCDLAKTRGLRSENYGGAVTLVAAVAAAVAAAIAASVFCIAAVAAA